jgi:hypothetical protein
MDFSTLPAYPGEDNDLLIKPPRDGDPNESAILIACCFFPLLVPLLVAVAIVVLGIVWIIAEVATSEFVQLSILDVVIFALGRRVYRAISSR